MIYIALDGLFHKVQWDTKYKAYESAQISVYGDFYDDVEMNAFMP